MNMKFAIAGIFLALSTPFAVHAESLAQRVTNLETQLATQAAQIAALQIQLANRTSQAFTAFTGGGVVLPANNFLPLVSLILPAGKYVVHGQVEGRPYSGQPDLDGIGCQLWSNTVPDAPIGGGETTLLAYYFETNPIGSIDLPSGGTVWIQCRTDHAATVIIDQTSLIAIQVVTIN
ncbi:MAG: hypothetical protein ABUT39_22510 [Acidobacteriota bacterium]